MNTDGKPACTHKDGHKWEHWFGNKEEWVCVNCRKGEFSKTEPPKFPEEKS